MKRIIMLLIAVGIFGSAPAQSNQIKVYLQQIAANKVYIVYLQKAYKIANKGLTTIGKIRRGEFQLHTDFFNALKNVNPAIQGMPQVKDMLMLHQKINQCYADQYRRIVKSDQLTESDIRYIRRVYERVLQDSDNTLEALQHIIASNYYTMTDDERIKRIEALYLNMQDNEAFIRQFSHTTMLLILQREKEQNDIRTSHRLYNLR